MRLTIMPVLIGAFIMTAPFQADATLVTQNYEAAAEFDDGGPVSSINFSFGISYDTASSTIINKAVDYFSSSSSYASFLSGPVDFTKVSNSIFIYAAGFGLNPNSPDFQLIVGPNPSTVLPPLNFSASYTVGDGSDRHVSSFGSIQAVPEPSAWLLMLSGFGLIGNIMRRKGAGRPAWRSC